MRVVGSRQLIGLGLCLGLIPAARALALPSVFPTGDPTVSHPGAGCLWLASGTIAPGDEDWIQIDPDEGGVESGGEMDLRVDVQRAGLSSGTHSATIVLRTNGGNREVAIAVEVSPAVLHVEPAVCDFAETLDEATVSVHNLGGGALIWTIESDETWISAEPAAGETTRWPGRAFRIRCWSTGTERRESSRRRSAESTRAHAPPMRRSGRRPRPACRRTALAPRTSR